MFRIYFSTINEHNNKVKEDKPFPKSGAVMVKLILPTSFSTVKK